MSRRQQREGGRDYAGSVVPFSYTRGDTCGTHIPCSLNIASSVGGNAVEDGHMPDTKCTKLTRSNPRRSIETSQPPPVGRPRPSTRRRSAPPQGSLIFTARHGRFFAALCYGEKDTAAHGNYCIPAARRSSP